MKAMLDIDLIVVNANARYEGKDLIHYYRHVMRAPNAKVPYHNVRHMLHVPWEAYDGADRMGLDPRTFRNVMIAALMHDYNHTGVKNDDAVNIERAIRALHQLALEEDRPYMLDIQRMIEATRYPYGDRAFELPDLILRDADQSQTFSVAWIQSVMYGLSTELEISPDKMLRDQLPYLESLKFYTLWGQNKFGPLIQPRIELVKRLIRLSGEEVEQP